MAGPSAPPKTLVLCFDGTGNKFSGTEADSNVLKIFRMLDSRSNQVHYYQPGIGTYVSSTTFSNTGFFTRVRSALAKAKDSAVGSSFADHVMAGYRFLMRHYAPGDNMYFFGFSRGAYTARFLAEMLDYVGLLAIGNEELVRFAWKNYAKWQERDGRGEEFRKEHLAMYNYMKAFRETFSRPVKPVQFIGLFDTVNSVPRFESAWMRRSKFPYTAKTSAKIIRHAVGIDERRAKFRQDLISQVIQNDHHHHHFHSHYGSYAKLLRKWGSRKIIPSKRQKDIPSVVVDGPVNGIENQLSRAEKGKDHDRVAGNSEVSQKMQYQQRYRPASPYPSAKLEVPNTSGPGARADDDAISTAESCQSRVSLSVPGLDVDNSEMQDIQEVWFPGGHADIGGGWELAPGELWQLSHPPLVWMVHEAQKAGLIFNQTALKQFECEENYSGEVSPIQRSSFQFASHAELQRQSVLASGLFDGGLDADAIQDPKREVTASEAFHAALHLSCTQGKLHDCLAYNTGVPSLSVTLWSLMEYLPFRRMDLQKDGSWKPIRWPLPRGEVRDIPDDAQIHVSAIRRLQARDDYRPGNLIIGGGGRGIKRLPKDHHIGDWDVLNHKGCPIRETYIRRKPAAHAKE